MTLSFSIKTTISKRLRENVENGKVGKIPFKRKFSEFIRSRRKNIKLNVSNVFKHSEDELF